MKATAILFLGLMAFHVFLLHQVVGLEKNVTAEPRSYLSYFSQLAQSFSRQMTTSQVLTFNMTNALILVLLKILMVSASFFGKGFHLLGRTADAVVNEHDLPWAVTYMTSANEDNFQCLYRRACEEPEVAQDYIIGAKMLNKVFRALKWIVPYNPKYEVILRSMDDAVATGQRPGKSCSTKYSCEKTSL